MSRRGRTSRHHDTESTRPRVPIIPMLDMSFQLLAFGLTTFDLAPQMEEGQLSLALPKSGDEAPTPMLSETELNEPEVEFTLRVTADGAGQVGGIELTTTSQTRPEPLPKDIEKLTETLLERKNLLAADKPPKLDVQIDPELNYQVVFRILGAADKAEFKKVTPNLLGEQKPAEPEQPKLP